jgi:hypothetical protein
VLPRVELEEHGTLVSLDRVVVLDAFGGLSNASR